MISHEAAKVQVELMTGEQKADVLMQAAAVFEEFLLSDHFKPHEEGLGSRWLREGQQQVRDAAGFARSTAHIVKATNNHRSVRV